MAKNNLVKIVSLTQIVVTIIGFVFSGFVIGPEKAEAYPTLAANADNVPVNGYWTSFDTGSSNWGAAAGETSREVINKGHQYRIRQNGTVTRAEFYVNNKTNLSAVYIKIWRKSGSNYNLVGSSENIVGSLTAGITNLVTLSTPITGVQEGDYYGTRWEFTPSASTNNFNVSTDSGNVITYYVDNTTPGTTNYNWEGQSSVSGNYQKIRLYMQAPQMVFIGDSRIGGATGNVSFITSTTSANDNAWTNLPYTMPYQLTQITGYTYQNMGIGGQNSTQVAARFTADAVNLKPRMAVIEGGINGIRALSENESQFLANYEAMLDACDANNIICFVIKMGPWTDSDDTEAAMKDTWNASLALQMQGHPNAVLIDTDEYVGQDRLSGPPGNLWDMVPAYENDDNHWNQTGYGLIAQAIIDQALSPLATFDNDFATWEAGDTAANYNLFFRGDTLNALNISQTGASGIEYSTDNSIWADATQGSGGDGMTGLTGSVTGANRQFSWASGTNLPTTEDSTVYLRIRPNDGTTSAPTWVVSNPFGIDNVAPSSVGAPTFGTITASSIVINKPSSVTEAGSGLNTWQARRDSATPLLTVSNATATVTDTSLSPNTSYTYDVRFADAVSNISSFGTTATKYTLANIPGTPLGSSSATTTAVVVVNRNDNPTGGGAAGDTQYALFESGTGKYVQTDGTLGTSAAWQTYSQWGSASGTTVSGLTAGTSYTFSIKARNGEAVETALSTGVVLSTVAEAETTTTDETYVPIPTIVSPTTNEKLIDTTPRIIGLAASGNTVQFYIDGVLVGSTTASTHTSGTGSFVFTVTDPIDLGEHLLQVEAIDADDNTSRRSEGQTFQIIRPTIGPTLLSIVSGSAIVNGVGWGDTDVTVYANGKAVGVFYIDGEGIQSFSYRLPMTADGRYAITMQATDNQDRPSRISNTIHYTQVRQRAVSPLILRNDRTYVVQSGDTLWRVSRTVYGFGTQYQKIIAANSTRFPSLVTNPSQLKKGWALLIP